MEPKKVFLENSPIFKAWWNKCVEKWREQEARGIAAMRRAQTERHIGIFIVLGLVALYWLATQLSPDSFSGPYCDYP